MDEPATKQPTVITTQNFMCYVHRCRQLTSSVNFFLFFPVKQRARDKYLPIIRFSSRILLVFNEATFSSAYKGGLNNDTI